jgi:hypothetical protein
LNQLIEKIFLFHNFQTSREFAPGSSDGPDMLRAKLAVFPIIFTILLKNLIVIGLKEDL